MKTIGIIAEGPRDSDMISALISHITCAEQKYLYIQPDMPPDYQPTLSTENQIESGWKGVWKWCDDQFVLTESYFNSITPKLDMLVFHMDADVARNEKEVHCFCDSTHCVDKRLVHPLRCAKVKNYCCPIILPCAAHLSTVHGNAHYLKNFVLNRLGDPAALPICVTVPSDSTDAWIVAAFDAFPACENILDPWTHIIAKAPVYHGIKIRNRPKKSKITYQSLIHAVCENWETVKQLCLEAQYFEDTVKAVLGD